MIQSLREAVGRHSVTVVHGGGGCGKSVLALQFLMESEAVALSVHAGESAEGYLAGRLRRLRSETQYHRLPDDSLEEAIERLRTANPATDPVLVVDIDAIDELRFQDRGDVYDLVRRWVSGQLAGSGAKLVVSYRPEQPGERGLHLFLAALTGMPSDQARELVGVVSVGDFSEDELAEAANRLDGAAERRLLGSLPSSEGAVFGSEGRPVFAPIVNSLRHPVVWGAYATLDPDARMQVLEGETGGTARLAEVVLERFLTKCVSRGNHGWQIDRLERALREITRIATQGPFGQQEVWVAGCAALIGSEGAIALYREALTYGLILENEKCRWQWRHPFLPQHLSGGTP